MQDDGKMYRELDVLLMCRKEPCMPEGMCERIIAAAVRCEETRRFAVIEPRAQSLWESVLRDFTEMLYIPRPAYVFATLLVMGVSMGTYSDYLSASAGFLPGVTTDELSGFMSIEDRFVATEFLNGDTL